MNSHNKRLNLILATQEKANITAACLTSLALWGESIISAVGRLRQEDCREFENNLDYRVSAMLTWNTEQNQVKVK